jgi:hypothetical protein
MGTCSRRISLRVTSQARQRLWGPSMLLCDDVDFCSVQQEAMYASLFPDILLLWQLERLVVFGAAHDCEALVGLVEVLGGSGMYKGWGQTIVKTSWAKTMCCVLSGQQLTGFEMYLKNLWDGGMRSLANCAASSGCTLMAAAVRSCSADFWIGHAGL